MSSYKHKINFEEIEDNIRALSSNQFELFIADLWDKFEYRTECTAESSDRGIDVWAINDFPYNHRIAIQAKRHTDNIGSPIVRKCAGLHQRNDVDVVVIATSSSFTQPAREEAELLNVKLIDCLTLAKMIVLSESSDILKPYIDGTSTEKNISKQTDAPNQTESVSRGYILNVIQDSTGITLGEGDIEHNMDSDAAAYRTAIATLIDNDYLTIENLPVIGGETRYIVAKEPEHSDGTPMEQEHEVRDGFWVETNLNSDEKINRLSLLIETIVTNESNSTNPSETSLYRIHIESDDGDTVTLESSVQSDVMVEYCSYLIQEKDLLDYIELPYTPFGERALLNNERSHPDPGLYGIFREIDTAGVYLNTNYSKHSKVKRIQHLADLCGVDIRMDGSW